MGNGGNVFRLGDTVLRPRGPHDGAVRALLGGLARTTFSAPVPLGSGPDGTLSFSWIEGDVAVPPFPAWAMTDDALAGAVRLLRAYHDVAASLELPVGLDWSDEMADPHGGPIICHNDVCPENVVYRGGCAVALLDFDFAAPGRPLWDLAQMTKMWAPLRPRDRAVTGMAELDPFHRLGVIARAYGLARADHEEFVEALIECRRVGIEFVRGRLRAGEPAFVEAWALRGGEAALELDLVWVIERSDALLAALS
jgi:hypothetical protein